ncbi:MAG: hypothetical protein D6680_21945 [Cyanobacteria bacterium J007]|nr:MAG: hypothetical protein D6680_21945 [Cyanobacteria bacterium J007]
MVRKSTRTIAGDGSVERFNGLTKLIKCVTKLSIEIVISTESRLGSQHHEGDEAARRWGVRRPDRAIAGHP